MNEQIRISPVRLIGPDNEQLGIVPTNEALDQARQAGMDLVEVAGNVRPPVCRIIDYGKWKYHQKKHQKKSHEQVLKEVRIRPKTDDHDRMIKVNRAIRFFEKGDKVQFTMMFRGRERAHREIGYDIFKGIIAEFGDKVKVERAPGMDGRNMMMILAPVKGAFDKDTEDEKKAPAPAKKSDEKRASKDAEKKQEAESTDTPQAADAPVEASKSSE